MSRSGLLGDVDGLGKLLIPSPSCTTRFSLHSPTLATAAAASWNEGVLSPVSPPRFEVDCQMDASDALRLQAATGYGQEDTTIIIESMAQVGEK
jgi:hypothetical protein